ncbi:NAD-dependent epimerase/dehydratase family protein [Accumulibacter sp.]|uniref:NAD-dependent epimerase/dehydratase family protein n=1 Tax=Accumulibacter sp. TaxID=2053492 RepID=UPI0026257C13|nr:NAD-dependent epimerase/dehydratase family protein [Accumulibacter sp.]
MRVAITGARGFIGSHLLRHLKASGHEVVALGRAPGSKELQAFDGDTGRGCSQVHCPLEELVAGVDVIMHLAGRSSLDRSVNPRMGSQGTSSLTDYLDSNVVLTERLLRAAVASRTRRFVFASSRMVYPSWIAEARTEEMNHRPDSAYGLSKSIAEDLVRMYSDDERLVGVSLRLSQVIGPGDGGRGVLPRFIESARAGVLPTVHGQGRAVRDFVDVRDVARAFELVAEVPLRSQVMNIGGERGYSVRELAEVVAGEGGLDPSQIGMVSTDNEDCSTFTLDSSRAKQAVGWTPDWSLLRSIRERLVDAC